MRQSLVRFYDATLGRPSGRNRRLLEESLRAICRDLEALEASVSLREMSRDLEALRATVALYSTVQFRLPLPPMGGWAIGPDFACELVREIIRRRPRAILELGTGASTLVSGYALEMGGGGKQWLSGRGQQRSVWRREVPSHRRQGLEGSNTVGMVEGDHQPTDVCLGKLGQ